jgi:hypothetical protein
MFQAAEIREVRLDLVDFPLAGAVSTPHSQENHTFQNRKCSAKSRSLAHFASSAYVRTLCCMLHE